MLGLEVVVGWADGDSVGTLIVGCDVGGVGLEPVGGKVGTNVGMGDMLKAGGDGFTVGASDGTSLA